MIMNNAISKHESETMPISPQHKILFFKIMQNGAASSGKTTGRIGK